MSVITDKGQELDLVIRQGATFGPIICTLKDELNVAINITGATFEAQIRKTPNSRKATGCAVSTAMVDAVNGQFSFTITATESAKLLAGDTENSPESLYYWDLEMTLGTVVTPFCYGTVKVFREVTKAL
jgi:uncharacterized cupin superfamily protein